MLSIPIAVSVNAAELSQDSLQGYWLITELQGRPDDDGDKWQFEENRFYQNLGGRSVAHISLKRRPALDLGYAKITVLSFDGKVMEATTGGANHTLIKQ